MPEGQEENCSNPDSHLVSHDSTNESLPCLTLLIGREAVFSWRYGRRWRWRRCDRPYTYDLALLPQVKKVKRPTPFRFRGHPHPGSKKKFACGAFGLRTSDFGLQIDLEVLSLQTQTQTHVHVPLPPAAEVTAGRQARGPECFSKSPQKEGSPSPRRRNM